MRTSLVLLPQGYFKENPLNIEKTTYSVLSVLLLIYAQNIENNLLVFNLKKSTLAKNILILGAVSKS